MIDGACQVPLIERLRSVPIKAREMVEIDPTCHRNIPYGAMLHEAADSIEQMRAALEYQKQAMQEAAERTGIGRLCEQTEAWRIVDRALNIPAK